MEENIFNIVNYKMSEEGFDYCFDGYSSWEDVYDEKFHELRKNYLKAKRELKAYVVEHSDNEDEE